MIRQKLSDYNITGLYGFGGSDQDGEWHSYGSGGYMYIQNTHLDCKHNYSMYFRDMIGEKGYNVTIYLCMTASNSDNFLLCQTKFGTIRECKWFAMEFIRDFEQGTKFEKLIAPRLNEMYRPVFGYIDGKMQVLGESVFGVNNDINDQCGTYSKTQFSYFKKETPQYYRLGTNIFYEEYDGGVRKTEIRSGCISGGPLKVEELLKVQEDISKLRSELNIPLFSKRETRVDLIPEKDY